MLLYIYNAWPADFVDTSGKRKAPEGAFGSTSKLMPSSAVALYSEWVQYVACCRAHCC